MKTLLSACALVSFFAVAAARASVEIKPVLGASSLSGQTNYDITFGTLDPVFGIVGGESKLEFDLKAVLTRVGLEADIDGGLISFEAGYAGAVSKGSGKLRDRDWLYSDTLGFDSLGGDTLSDTKSPIGIFDIGMKGRLLKRTGVRLYGLLDYEYQKLGTFYVYNIDGVYSGWMTYDAKYNPTGKAVSVDETFSTPVLSYEINYGYYTVGLECDIDLGAGFSVESTAKAGYLTYSDRDDHILRSKLSTGSGTGFGGDIAGALSWRSKSGLGFTAFARYKSFTADGKQTQVYYAGPDADMPYQVTQTVNANELNFGGEVSFKFGSKHDKKRRDSEKIADSMAALMAREKVATGMNNTVAAPATPVPTPSASTWPVTVPTSTASETNFQTPGNNPVPNGATPGIQPPH